MTAQAARVWAQMRRLSRMAEPKLAALLVRAMRALQNGVSERRLAEILTHRDVVAIHDLVGRLPLNLQQVAPALQQVMLTGAQVGKFQLPSSAQTLVILNQLQPEIGALARKQAATLVTRVTTETRAAIREVIARSFAEGISPRDTAKAIKPLIGLTRGQARAVLAERARYVARGWNLEAATAKVVRYADQLLRARALLIARTEIIGAETRGQLAAWDRARARGFLAAGAEKVWMTTRDDRLCPYCAALDKQAVELNGLFVSDVGRVVGPPLHPNCRCAIWLRPAYAASRLAA